MEDKTDSRLYIRVGCSVCLGSRRQGVFMNCPYCDKDRKQMIEASLSAIKDSLHQNLSADQKQELIKFLQEE
tara:strand:- start:325 stop:540 length:216 start_codon:yes stop_codon:yes gene_type:complete